MSAFVSQKFWPEQKRRRPVKTFLSSSLITLQNLVDISHIMCVFEIKAISLDIWKFSNPWYL